MLYVPRSLYPVVSGEAAFDVLYLRDSGLKKKKIHKNKTADTIFFNESIHGDNKCHLL